MQGTGKFLSGLLAGAVIGVVSGMLLAPSSGNQIRRTIVRKSRRYSQQAVDVVQQYLEGVRQGRVKPDPALDQRGTEELLNRLANERSL